MKYQLAATSVAIGNKENRDKTEEGHYIPYLEAVFYPQIKF